MGRHVTALVYVSHPETGVAHVLNVGDEVPEWAEITNPDVLAEAEPEPEADAEAEAPVRKPRTSKPRTRKS